MLPAEARPDPATRKDKVKSYTLSLFKRKMQVLLTKRAFYVRACATVPEELQLPFVSANNLGDVQAAWDTSITKSFEIANTLANQQPVIISYNAWELCRMCGSSTVAHI